MNDDGQRPSPTRILVVDDSFDTAEALSEFLKDEGYETRIEGDGPAAIEAFEAFRPQLVFLDIGLPGMSGLEVAAVLRKAQAAAYLVALTGYGGPEEEARTRAAGFDEHLVKPASLARIEAALKRGLG